MSNMVATNRSDSTLTVPPRQVRQTFMDFDLELDLGNLQADIVILGLPYGDPYNIDEVTNDQTNAPTAIRQASRKASGGLERWDFDIGGTLRPRRASSQVNLTLRRDANNFRWRSRCTDPCIASF